MGNGKLYNQIGYGGATVFNPATAVNDFTGILQQQQAKRQQEQQLLANELSKVKTDGLRNDADRQVFFNKYNDIKSLAAQIPYETNNWKKAQLKAQVDQNLLDLNDYAVRSKQQGINETDWSKSYMTKPEIWGDDALAAAQASKQAALDGNGVIKDFTTLQRQPNVDKINKDLSGMVKANLQSQKWQDNITRGQEGNKPGVYTESTRKADPEALYHGAANYYDVSHDFQRHLQQLYPQAFATDNPVEAKATAVKQYVDDAVANNTLGAVQESKPKKFDADWRARVGRQGSSVVATNPVDTTLPYNNGSGHVTVKGFVPVTGATSNFAGSPSYNLSTGTIDPQVMSSGDHQIVGIGNYPFIKQGVMNDPKLDGTIAQPNFAKEHPDKIENRPMIHVQSKDANDITEDHLIPYDKLPANLPKATRAAIANFKPATNQSAPTKATVASTQNVKKSISQGDIPGAAAAAGYSVKEYTDLLKQKGIEIQSGTKRISVTLPNGTSGYVPEDRYSDFAKKHPDHIVHQ